MSLSDQELLDVMSFADGELSGKDLERVQALVVANAEAKELVASMRALGDGVRSVAAIEPIDVTTAVMAGLVPNDLDKARLKRHARTRTIGVVVTLTALAAGAFLYTRGQPDETAAAPIDVGPAVASVVPPPMTAAPALAKNEAPGIQIDSVDTTSPVSVFYVSSTDDNSSTSSSVVVWIDDPAVGAK